MGKPSKKALGKRKAPPAPEKSVSSVKRHSSADNQSNKKAKAQPEREVGPTGKPKRRPDQPKKVKLRDQKFIPVPKTEFASDDDEDLMDLGEDDELDIGQAGGFASGLDRNALSR